MSTNLPYLGNHQYACHTAESDYRKNRFGIPLNRRRILFFVRLPTDSISERKNCRCLAKLPSLSKLNHSPSSRENQTLLTNTEHWETSLHVWTRHTEGIWFEMCMLACFSSSYIRIFIHFVLQSKPKNLYRLKFRLQHFFFTKSITNIFFRPALHANHFEAAVL